MPADVLDHLAGPLGLYEEIGRAPAGGSPADPAREAYRFRVSLLEVVPPVWRTIEVPSTYTFWDLHVAIQDAMGWRDCHLHAFRVTSPSTGALLEIGIPNDDPFEGEPPVTPGWGVPIASHFTAPMAEARYEYDFGDSWEHLVVLEAVTRVAPDTRLPRCTGGARACPPEDCGGPWGYERLLSIIRDPDHEEHDEMLVWLGGSFDPDRFDPAQVAFDDPRRRWRIAFEDAPEPAPPPRRRPGRRRPRRH
jgi:hypothetical protein